MPQFWEATLGPGHMGPPQSHQFWDSASAARVQPTSLGPGHCHQSSGFGSGKPSTHPAKRCSICSAPGAVGLPNSLACLPVFPARWGHVSVPTAQSTGTGPPESRLGMEKEGTRHRTLEGSPPTLVSRYPMNGAFFSQVSAK